MTAASPGWLRDLTTGECRRLANEYSRAAQCARVADDIPTAMFLHDAVDVIRDELARRGASAEVVA